MAKAAMERALTTQSDVLNTMTHPELGEIDFRWERGSKSKGLAKILAKHGEMSARLIPFVIARGQTSQRQGYEVVLTNYYDEKGRGR